MNSQDEENLKGKSTLFLRIGVGIAFLYALSWSLHTAFNVITFCSAGYFFFLAWYYYPRQPKASEPYQSQEWQTPEERIKKTMKKVVAIIGFSVFGILFLLFLIGIFAGDPDKSDTSSQSEVTEVTEVLEDTDPNDVTSLLERGNSFYNEKQYDSAMFYYNRVLSMEPGNSSAFYNKGLVYYDQQQHDQALEQFSRAYDNGMRDPFLSHVLGYLQDNKGNTSTAINFYREALSLDSARADIYSRLAELEPGNASKWQRLYEKWKN